ncbi:arylamine N-acetyltransferase / N-hydroxyarylamine O-acetyltransferase-like [Haemaphysalis longicornis]
MDNSNIQVNGKQRRIGIPNPSSMTECAPGWSEFPMEPLSTSQAQEYLRHLGVGDAVEPTRHNLDTLIHAHLERVPFENIDRLLDRPVLLNAEAVFGKVLRSGRGGSCFELNSLFGRLLLALGYRLQLRSARLRLFVPDNDPTLMTTSLHLMLCVQFADDDCHRYLVDVASGATGFCRALPLKGNAEPYRVRHLDAPLPAGTLEISIPSKGRAGHARWKVLYIVDADIKHWLDFVPLNWFSGTHPESSLRHMLVVGHLKNNGSWLRLIDNHLCRWSRDGVLEAEEFLGDENDIIGVLQQEFGLRLKVEDEVQPLLLRLRDLLTYSEH